MTGDSLTVYESASAPEDGVALQHGGTWYLANYLDYRAAEHGTTPVGYFGYYGYGLTDMSGNVFEWTSSAWNGSRLKLRGGGWFYPSGNCAVSYRLTHYPATHYGLLGFRICR